jgi:Mg-chelatase subunit ChlD
MFNYPFTNSDKGFIFSLDAVLAILIVLGLISFALVTSFDKNPSTISRTNISQLSDDAITALDNAGYFQQEIDINGFSSIAATSIHNKIKALYPGNVDINLVLKEFTFDSIACQATENFQDCFKDANILTLTTGTAIPTNKEIVHGKKVFTKKQPTSQCALQLSEENPKNLEQYKGPLYFQEPPPIGIDFNVTVTPSTGISCDENIFVTLSVGIANETRKPVDVMVVMDTSGSMNGCVIVDGNELAGFPQTGTIDNGLITFGFYVGWQQIATFDIPTKDPFQVLMTNDTPCTTNCPELYIKSPNGNKQWGFYGGAPSNGCYVSSDRVNHLMIPASSSQIGTWEVWAWNDDPTMDYNLNVEMISGKKTKLDAAKDAAKEFIQNALWKAPDQFGLASFGTQAQQNQPLNPNINPMLNAIDALSASGGTALGDGIYAATSEQLSVRGNPDALWFQVLLADGGWNIGSDPVDAANDAAANGITIFTIGFGEDADETQLTNIANITGGQYYFAEDENVLQQVYAIIAQEIFLQANDSNVLVPIDVGTIVIDLGGGVLVDGNILFDVGTLTSGTDWNATYILNFPCDNANNCSFDAITFPGPGTIYTYWDANGLIVVDWNQFVTLPYSYRDLTVNFNGGQILSQNSVSVDVNAANIGDLNSEATNVKFYLNDPDAGGTFLSQASVPFLCGGKDPLCAVSFQLINETLPAQGTIYAIINDDNSIRECSGNNKDLIYCFGEPATQFYSIDYYVWWK